MADDSTTADDTPQAEATPRRRGWLRRFLGFVARLTLLLTVVVLLAGGAGYLWLRANILSELPSDLSTYRDYRPPTVCTVVGGDGAELDRFYVERRWWVSLDELPPHVWQAFVAAEDRRFFEHPGVDLLGIGRAAWSNFQAGDVTQGGSTITQQLVKNLIVGKERSYERKLKEAILAYRLERELGKEAILELFVNYVFLGAGNYGVEAAARDYFGVSARQLDPGQAALIAGLIPAPSRYHPRRSQEIARQRRAIVLEAMVATEMLTAEEAEVFLDDPVLSQRKNAVPEETDRSYVTQVRREVRRLLPEGVVFGEGLTVHTPFRADVQQAAEDAIRQALLDHRSRQGWLGPVRSLSVSDAAAFLARGDGLKRDRQTAELQSPAAGACFPVLVGKERDLGALQAGPFTFPLRAEDRATTVRNPKPEAPPVPLQRAVRPGDVLQACLLPEGTLALAERPWAEGAAVVIENQTGRVLALVGGWQVGLEGFVRATQARRQPGSSFKPYVYATALLRGKRQTDTVVDAPLSLIGSNGKPWSPKNYDGGYAGALPMRTAMAKSLNTVAVRMALEAGPSEVTGLARRMGVQTRLRTDPTVALGSSEVTPMDQARGYATIARLGRSVESVYIDRLVDVDGRTIGQAGGAVMVDGEAVQELPGGPQMGEQVLPPGVAYELADMLREVVRAGTARRAWRVDRDRFGKTGTTNGFQDAWFVGFTPEHTVAVWIGTDGTTSLGEKETGGRAALPAWIKIVEALDTGASTRLAVPDEAVLVPWNGQYVGLPRGLVPQRVLGSRPTVKAGVPLGL